MKHFKLFFGVFCFLSFLGCALCIKAYNSSIFHVDIKKRLDILSPEERMFLEELFLGLHYASSSYVLFGDKPISLCSFLDERPCYQYKNSFFDFMDFAINKFQPFNIKMVKGWNSWEKHKNLFPSSNFSLVKNECPGEIVLVMINKKAFLKVVKENLDDFQSILGSKNSETEILEQVIHSKDLFKDVLKSNHFLLGLILGYGRQNALLFYRRNQIEATKNISFSFITQLTPSEGFSTLDEEYYSIDQSLSFFNDTDIKDINCLLMGLPMFVADINHPETKELQKKYTEQYKFIIKQYKSADFLETTLNQFVNGQ